MSTKSFLVSDPGCPKRDDVLADSIRGTEIGVESGKSHFDHMESEPNVSFLDMVRSVLERKANDPFATWYNSQGNATNEYTFGKLWEEAGVISYYIREKWGAQKGDRVVLCYNFGLHFFASFLGCLRAGVTAVLVYPPGPPLVTSLGKMMKVVEDCSPVLILTDFRVNFLRKTDRSNPLSHSRKLWPKDVSWMVTDKLSSGKSQQSFDEEILSSNDIAFLQYTSGSTGDPKGVMVSFSALAANVKLIHKGFYNTYTEDRGVPNEIVGFSWLPQYHDLGLIHAVISPFAGGWRMHMMSPITFIQNPLLWFELMSRLRVSWGVAPDFAYHLVARKFKEEKDRAGGKNPIRGLDLSCIHFLQNCAEPIRLNTWQMISELFSEYNLRENWFQAGYGLAEHVVAVCWVHKYSPSTPRDENESPIMASGARQNFDSSLTMKIVDPQTLQEVEDGVTGEVWISGGSVTEGYFNKHQLTDEVFHAKLGNDSLKRNFLRTGDLAFFQRDYLYICGRIKDLIICNGVNYYPQDIEHVVQDASSAVRPGCVAAFTREEVGNDGELEIVFEIRTQRIAEAAEICEVVRSAVIQTIGVAPSRVVAIAERTICKTTSGKIQRKATRTKLHDGKHSIVFDLDNSPAVRDKTCCDFDSTPLFADEEGDGSDSLNDIFVRFFGAGYDAHKTWDELGLSSMVAVELRNSISNALAVSLPVDWFEQYPTPSCLDSFISGSCGKSLPVKLSNLSCRETVGISWYAMRVIQTFGIALLFLLFAASIIPAYYVGQLVTGNGSLTVVFNVADGQFSRWIWIPAVIPTWMLSFSLSIIVVKWVVVRRYHEEEISIRTASFVRWWFVDRAVDMWENWVGQFVKDTPVLWLFYRLMGAKIHPSAQLNAFVREFDLVEIETGVSLDHRIRCRRFGPWQGDTGPTLRFRHISIGRFSSVQGMLCPGACVGEGAYVEHLSVVTEGAQVRDKVLAGGNPAIDVGHAPQPSSCCWVKLGIIKLFWLLAELYIFAALAMAAQIWLNDLLKSDWRYGQLCFWVLLIAIYSVLALALVIVLKWLLIGRRKPGQQISTFRTAADWIVDYHFQVSILALYPVSFNSRIWNGFLMLLGMDIDFQSKVYVDNFPPSQADLISVKRSFVSTSDFGTKKSGFYHRTEIVDSSVAIFVYTEPNVCLSRAIIQPCNHVNKDVIREHLDERALPSTRRSLVQHEATIGILYAVQLVLVFMSLIPAYELWVSALKPSTAEMAAPVLALALALQTFSWVLLLAVLQLGALLASSKHKRPWNGPMYAVYLSTGYAVQVISFLPLLWGTSLFNLVARFLGTTIEGRMLFFEGRIYEWPYITIADKTVVDSGMVSGHIVVYEDATLGPCRVSGVLHEGTHAFPWAVVTENESGPYCALFQSQGTNLKLSDDIENLLLLRKNPTRRQRASPTRTVCLEHFNKRVLFSGLTLLYAVLHSFA